MAATRLLSVHEALASPSYSDEEKFIIRWQRRHDLVLSPFEEALIEAILNADENHLDRLAKGYPDEVNGVRRWRSERGFAGRMREYPFDFSL